MNDCNGGLIAMPSKVSGSQFRELLLIAGPALLLVAGAFWLASRFVQPGPPTSLTMATASKGSPYFTLGERYQKILKRNGITLELKETGGSFDNLKALKDASSGVQAGFLQGGISSAKDAPELLSVGRLFHEPIWVFYKGADTFDRLTQLKGKRILVGPAGSGTNSIAMKLLAANDVTAANSTLITMEMPDYVTALQTGQADAGFLVLAPEARTVQRLFNTPDVRLMSMLQADAFTQRFPYLSRLLLRQGVVDFGKNIPPIDTMMAATTTGLLVRDDLHPALINLLTQAALEVHGQPLTDASTSTNLFEKAGEFPNPNDTEFKLAAEAQRVYKSGPPFMQKHVPFWVATFLDRMFVLLLPLVGIMVPLLKFVPMLYTWRVRHRILYWYRELKTVEHGLDASHADAALLAGKQREIERIEEAVNQIPVPLGFSDKLYDLRAHIDMVRRRLALSHSAIGARAQN